MVLLIASNGEQFSVEKEVAERSALIRGMLEDISGESDHPIPIPNVSSDTLQRVLMYCEHHRDDPWPSAACDDQDLPKREIVIEDWDRDYLALDQKTLFEVIMAANYLDIKDLLDIGCQTVANMIKGKTTKEIRMLFNITNDFTPDEEAAIRKENEWAEDH